MNGRIIPVISSKVMLPDDLHILAEQQRDLSAEDVENYSDSSTYSRGVTGILRIADIGLFWVWKCGNQSSFLQTADIGCIFAECRYFCKISATRFFYKKLVYKKLVLRRPKF